MVFATESLGNSPPSILGLVDNMAENCDAAHGRYETTLAVSGLVFDFEEKTIGKDHCALSRTSPNPMRFTPKRTNPPRESLRVFSWRNINAKRGICAILWPSDCPNHQSAFAGRQSKSKTVQSSSDGPSTAKRRPSGMVFRPVFVSLWPATTSY
jgi:hypothetical protein